MNKNGACNQNLMSRTWPRKIVFLLLALIATPQITNAISFERFTRHVLQSGEGSSDSNRRGISWVVTNFPIRNRISCDPTFYHSPLVLNIIRPDRSSFCFKISSKMPESISYTCQQAPSVGQVNRVQVFVAAGCADAVAGITIDERPWGNYTFDSASNILSIDRISSLPPLNASNPVDRTVCIQLRAENDTCDSITSFCAPAYGPQPACAVLIADSRGDCCPVNRISYANASIESSTLFRLTGKFNDGCESVPSETDLLARLTTQYRVALGASGSNVLFHSYSCRSSRMTAVFSVGGLKLDEPDQIVQRAAVMLKPAASQMGLVGVRASYFANESTQSPRRQPTRPRRPPSSIPPSQLMPDGARRSPPPLYNGQTGQAPQYASSPSPAVYGAH